MRHLRLFKLIKTSIHSEQLFSQVSNCSFYLFFFFSDIFPFPSFFLFFFPYSCCCKDCFSLIFLFNGPWLFLLFLNVSFPFNFFHSLINIPLVVTLPLLYSYKILCKMFFGSVLSHLLPGASTFQSLLDRLWGAIGINKPVTLISR